ncbi:MAG: DUF262 domain-containing protein [Chitinophagaceae bacterium]|nr:DUF262 domain-containing protein [Chitinophagaceae bacterium]
MIRKSSYKKKAELPYNPDDVNIRLQHFRTSELIDMIHGKRIFEDTWIDIWGEDDLQRNRDLWSNDQKSLFIESLMIKLPIPLFYFDGGQKPWRVIDGLQRLHSIMSFVDGENKSNFKLTGLEYLVAECNGKFFHEIPGYLRSRIMDAELEAYVINPGTPPEVKYNIFKRINTGGLKLKGQEIRNAFCRGIPAEFTKKLANRKEFIKVSNGKVSPRRMDDREYATRFIAFKIFGFTEYMSKMDIFLTEAMMDLYNRDKEERIELENSFTNSCNRIHNSLDQFALYRVNKDGTIGRQPNRALFDTLSWNFSELTESAYNKIITSKKTFQTEYKKYMVQDELLFKAIADTTGSKTAVKNRFERMNYFLKEFIQ